MDAANESCATREVDAVVIGAGFAGLYALYRLREQGLSVQLFEAGGGVGGTWYWNRYPGARTDSPSHVYQYWFSDELLREWDWKQRFPEQEETERYLNHVADRFGLREDICFNARVNALRWNEHERRWTVRTDASPEIRCKYVVSCIGLLSEPQFPDIPGLDSFRGRLVHTARWPREGLSLQGKRVGVVGTGATGVQVIQTLAAEVGELFVFQRTANYTIPMRNTVYGDADRERLRAQYPETREIVKHTFIGFDCDLEPRAWSDVSAADRRQLLERLWADGSLNFWTSNFREMLVDPAVSAEVTEFVREKMRARIRKPELAKKLVPDDHYFGTRRTPLDLGYLEAYDRPNVHLVDIQESPIEQITEKGLTTGNGDYPLDVLIFATGFDAGTGAYSRIDIRGREGRSLQSIWSHDIRTAMGMQVHGFPNLFLTSAPLAPAAAFCNVPTCAQQQVDWISDCIAHVQNRAGAELIEATAEFEAKWVAHHDELADATLLKATKSWWRGTNIEGKQNRLLAYIGGVGGYRKLCDDVAARGYEGFVIS